VLPLALDGATVVVLAQDTAQDRRAVSAGADRDRRSWRPRWLAILVSTQRALPWGAAERDVERIGLAAEGAGSVYGGAGAAHG
jgi:hypothetical protein